MKISSCYPSNAKKLYHRKPGDVIQFKNNDSTHDDAFYLVTRDRNETHYKVVKLTTGAIVTTSVTRRTVLYENAYMVPEEPS